MRGDRETFGEVNHIALDCPGLLSRGNEDRRRINPRKVLGVGFDGLSTL